jgi:hypothetical protein
MMAKIAGHVWSFDELVESDLASPQQWWTDMKRMLTHASWHSFGFAATCVFMVGLMSFTSGNSTFSEVPTWAWAAISAIGFVAMLRYMRWRHER